MFLFAIAHIYAFKTTDFRGYESTHKKEKAHQVLIAVANLHTDIFTDTKTMITHYKTHTKYNVFKGKTGLDVTNTEPDLDYDAEHPNKDDNKIGQHSVNNMSDDTNKSSQYPDDQ